MSSDSKSSKMKKQTIAHWRDNLKRVKAMNWAEWAQLPHGSKVDFIFIGVYDKYPYIGGEACPYCTHYRRHCRTMNDVQCPLKQETVPGGCCVAWLNVREALIVPWSKKQAIAAIKAMIEYIKEKG